VKDHVVGLANVEEGKLAENVKPKRPQLRKRAIAQSGSLSVKKSSSK